MRSYDLLLLICLWMSANTQKMRKTWACQPVQLFTPSKPSSITYTDIVFLFFRVLFLPSKLLEQTSHLVSLRRTVWSQTQRWDVCMMADDIYTYVVFPGLLGKPAGTALSRKLSPSICQPSTGRISSRAARAAKSYHFESVVAHQRYNLQILGFTFQVNWFPNLVGIAIKNYIPRSWEDSYATNKKEIIIVM